MNKVNPFPDLTTPLQLLFLSNLSIAGEAALVANLGKTYLTKRITISISAICLNLLSYYVMFHQ